MLRDISRLRELEQRPGRRACAGWGTNCARRWHALRAVLANLSDRAAPADAPALASGGG